MTPQIQMSCFFMVSAVQFVLLEVHRITITADVTKTATAVGQIVSGIASTHMPNHLVHQIWAPQVQAPMRITYVRQMFSEMAIAVARNLRTEMEIRAQSLLQRGIPATSGKAMLPE